MVHDSRFAKALRRAFEMMREDAEATARVVESAFGDQDEVNDEDLDRELRSLFYTLEREELLSVRRTEYTFEGQPRRAYFWRMKSLPEIAARDDGTRSLSRDEREAVSVYRGLPSELWTRHEGGNQ